MPHDREPRKTVPVRAVAYRNLLVPVAYEQPSLQPRERPRDPQGKVVIVLQYRMILYRSVPVPNRACAHPGKDVKPALKIVDTVVTSLPLFPVTINLHKLDLQTT
jgi:hypothetical protein